MLDWKYFIGGHGNIGSHDDFKFQRQFLNDLRDTTIKVRKEESFGKFMNKRQIIMLILREPSAKQLLKK